MNKWMRVLVVGLVLAFLFWVSVITQGVYFGVRIVRWFYDMGAKVYDLVKDNPPEAEAAFIGRPLVERLLAAAAERAAGAPEGDRRAAAPRVLDIATGTGRLPVTLLAHPEFAGTIVGVDLSYGMLAMAAQKLDALGAPDGGRVTLVNAPAYPLAFPDGCFDGVTSLEALELMPDLREAIREMVRVLRPGGWLAITNRTGPTAAMMPGRTEPTEAVVDFLRHLGLTDVIVGGHKYYWGLEFYALLFARKPAATLATVDNDHALNL